MLSCLCGLREAKEFERAVDPVEVLSNGVDETERQVIRKEVLDVIEAARKVLAELEAV